MYKNSVNHWLYVEINSHSLAEVTYNSEDGAVHEPHSFASDYYEHAREFS